jgi:hypothetical protein
MNRVVIRIAAASAVAFAVAAPPSGALAQEAPLPPSPPPPPPVRVRGPTTVILAPPPPRDVVVIEERTPNAGLIGGGLMMFGLSYGTSVIVGAASDRDGDQHLYVPLAGPWMDLAARGPCPIPGTCGNDIGNKALLVTDGILQAAGVLQIFGGFLFPQTITVTRTRAGVEITPTAGLHELGVVAHGAF